ncbi:general stress protein [Nostocoides vanveenii]|uniref:General stress protein 17M-like domain-containing protein n=1 Tax=Nostocoides vanveenii TaxID=330835 RepID=A0ABP4X2S6_9MICO
MTTQPLGARGPIGQAAFKLDYPMSLGVYDSYPEAQKAVDYLSDNGFPVQHVLIVGTDLKQVERVTGRLTRGRVAMGGALSGAWLGAFVGLVFSLFEDGNSFARIISTVIFGAIFGLVWALVGYSLTRGQRDFTSVSQVVATRYEVLTEHKFVTQGRELLTTMDPMKAAQAQVAEAQARAYAEAQAARDAAPATPPAEGQH